eukprot:5950080-Pleurochrysis_carterae.AAC.2
MAPFHLISSRETTVSPHASVSGPPGGRFCFLSGGATAELGTDGVEEMADKVAEEGVSLGNNTTGC